MSVHPDKTAWRTVDACGGVPASPTRTDYERGWDDALKTACEAVKKPDALMAELLEAAKGLRLVLKLAAIKYGFDLTESASLEAADAAIAKATGEA